MTAQLINHLPTETDIKDWLVKWIAKELDLSIQQIDTSNSLLEYSLSSMTAMMLVGDLEEWLKIEITPTLVWDYPSIDALVDFLAEATKIQIADRGLTQKDEIKQANNLLSNNSNNNQSLPDNLDELSEEEMDALLSELLK
jgi:acyl carrier protein